MQKDKRTWFQKLFSSSREKRSGSVSLSHENPDQFPVAYIEPDDPEMNEAIAMARSNYNEFVKTLEQKPRNSSSFAVKMVFNDEHLWFTNARIKRDKISVRLANEPEYPANKSMKFGSEFFVEPIRVTDWKYVLDNKVIGAYTTRLLVNRMTEPEKNIFHEQTQNIYK